MGISRIKIMGNKLEKDRKRDMKPLLIQGGHVIDPGQGIDATGSILIEEGRISWFQEGSRATLWVDYDCIDAHGLVVCPGFIDMHCHLREPGYEEKETIASGTRAAARGGFTTVCCMPNTNPPIDSAESVKSINSKADDEGIVRVLPIGCVSKGRLGSELVNMQELASAGVAGFSDDGEPVWNSRVMRLALEQSVNLGLPVIDHCEDKSLTEGGVMNEGVISIRLGLGGWPSVAEDIIVERDLMLAQLTGGRLHIAHVSTQSSVELIRRAKENGINVTAEVTPHHLTFTESRIIKDGTLAKVNPPLRTRKDVEALIKGLKDKVIDIIATDHAPHTEADKSCDFSEAAFGISGFETALGNLMTLVNDGHLTLPDLIARLTVEPARIIGAGSGISGTLATGTPADITIFDSDANWIVDTASFASKGKNTPLAGSVLKGRVMATIAAGKIVYKDNSIDVAEK